MTELFKPILINNITTTYEISSLGYVRNIKTGTILAPVITNCGYYRVGLYYRDSTGEVRHKHMSVHRLVAVAFIPNPDNLPEVNHRDGIKSHNYIDNLEWVTSSENDYHAYATGLKCKKYGDTSHLHKYTRDRVELACKLMDSGKYTSVEIEGITGISNAMLKRIYKRKSWCNISEKYHVENCKLVDSRNDGSRYTMKQMKKVFKLLSENRLSIYDISDETGVRVSTIRNVVSHRSGLHQYEYLYDVYDVNNYTGRKQVCHPLTDEIRTQIAFLVSIGKLVDDICKIIHDEHMCNEEYVRDYMRRNFK